MDEKQQLSVIEQPKQLILEGNPKAQLAYAQEAADALMERVARKPRKIVMNGKQYLEFGDWQMVSRFYGGTVGIEWSQPINRGNKIICYEARAEVRRHGDVIATAEAMCSSEEKNWKGRPEFAIRSMAQTRASAKALRNAFGWVVELAGYASTPAEEMEDANDNQPEEPGAPVALISVDEAAELRRVLKEAEIDEKEFLQQAKIDKIEDLEARRYQGAIGYYRKFK